jgi:hypothetical protein
MTATIPPTSAPSRRRRADETPRTARRRAPEAEGNRTEDRTVDKNMPDTTRDPGGPRKARTPKNAAAGRRRRPADDDPPRTRSEAPPRRSGAKRADSAVPGTKRSDDARTRRSPKAPGADRVEETGAASGTRRTGGKRAEQASAVPDAKRSADARVRRSPKAPGEETNAGTRRSGAKRVAEASTGPRRSGAKRVAEAGAVQGRSARASGAERPGDARVRRSPKVAAGGRVEDARAAPGTRRGGQAAGGSQGSARTGTGTTRKGAVAAPPSGREAPEGARRAAPPRARTPFVLLIMGLLAGALVSLLLLNTVLAQDAFTLSELQRGNHQLSERRQALQEEINRESSPEGMHARARELGMRDVQRLAFIDARTGRRIEGGARPPGVPDDAVAAAGATAVTGAPGAIVPPPRSGRTEGGTR